MGRRGPRSNALVVLVPAVGLLEPVCLSDTAVPTPHVSNRSPSLP
jgi:hypothetical protein